ncbi:hypothetical protein QBC33DRAFT_517403 [Phialemonium atrogriseum]|uniref:Uncharacterized protein n=1 Tax=Phialemonium atrogriseum TaxID=1093897 RepID=A0AAJ0BXC8_9PEZI|nr:uncharacterized protein QBC33DRAFT_517403 [Phialemonium atrogriseum]KAK1764812.1 hypothetical protein QBC33DRAFT_517403 [Phialemonium atrogriseum]
MGIISPIYQVSLSLQVLVDTCAYVAIFVPRYDHFKASLENSMLAIYEGVSLPRGARRLLPRRGWTTAPGDYEDPPLAFPRATPPAPRLREWFTGPIGKFCEDPHGGDVGFKLAFGFAAVSYLVLRTVEKRHFWK